MASTTTFLSLGLCFLFLVNGCLGELGPEMTSDGKNAIVLLQAMGVEQKVQHTLRAKTECRIERLTAQEPNRRFPSEAGETEFWDPQSDELVCAGVEVVRNTVQPKGLLMPHYNNAPQLVYIVQGRGILGVVIPGCAEMYQTGQQTGEDRGRRFVDRHQKIRPFKEGDILALPAGTAIWFYNDGEVPFVTVSLLDTSNPANQLDNNFRDFFLAGNPQQEQGQGEQEQEGQHYSSSNVFNGFDDEMLANAFNVETETIRRLKGEDDQRGRIVRVERFHITAPRWEEEEEEEEREPRNGPVILETVCSMKLRVNIGQPRNADVYNPRGGRISTANPESLPILNYLRLSAERGVLYQNALMGPHYQQAAHSIIYVTRGRGRIQIVSHRGVSVFDEEVQEGQLLVVPANFAQIKKASQQGLEWVSFKTNEYPMSVQLAGRASVFRAIPHEVLMNSYDISREDARSLKYNRDEFTVFSPRSRSTRD